MVNAHLKKQIIAASQELGIDKIGFTTAEDFENLRPSLMAQKAAGHTSGFEHQNLDERLNPELIFDQPRSIIAIALAYPSKMTHRPPRTKYKRGHFARASWGDDYHTVLNKKMTALIEKIKDLATNEVEFKPMVDTGELIDVAVAQRAGIGFIGKNGLLITKEFGSFVYLGEIITNLEFERDEPMESQCGDCTRCVDYCPPHALLGDGRLNAQKCLSYQTQTKGMMPEKYRPMIHNVIYGCDICQLVCPFNRGADHHFHPDMEPDPKKVSPELVPLLTISNREFKETYGPMAGSWRGKKPLQRNALIALANLGDKSALPQILEVIDHDPRPVIRATAAYAVGRLVREFNPEIYDFLIEKYQQEKQQGQEEQYLYEYRMAIQKISSLE